MIQRDQSSFDGVLEKGIEGFSTPGYFNICVKNLVARGVCCLIFTLLKRANMRLVLPISYPANGMRHVALKLFESLTGWIVDFRTK